jgi:hypothetical protein
MLSYSAVHDCGFVARCTLEGSDSGEARIDKIPAIIAKCKFGVHDISHTELSKNIKLPRFNMPLELECLVPKLWNSKYCGIPASIF